MVGVLEMIILTIILLLVILAVIYKPSIDINKDNMVVLWYGRKIRKYIVLIKGTWIHVYKYKKNEPPW